MQTLLLHTGFNFHSRFYQGYLAQSLIEVYIPFQTTQWNLPDGISFDTWYTCKYAALVPLTDDIDCFYVFNDIGGISLILPARFNIITRQS